MTDARTMANFRVGAQLFNYRAAGIAVRDGHVLICHEDDDDYVMLPGGRVEIGEPSDVALARELAEELRSSATIGRRIFTVENFFEHNGASVHEIAVYYAFEPAADFPFRRGGVVREVEEDGHLLRFEWLPIEGPALAGRQLYPTWMRERIAHLPETTEHLIVHEAR
jgi:8-oxo-dGTP pyrophosphatase MutT (NUDIX family)